MRRILLAALLIAACTNDATQPATLALSFSVASGDGQSGVVGQPLPNPLVIKATDSRGRPQKNLQVSFIIASGGGSANPASVRTDQNGLAQTSWTLGTSVAQVQGLEARASQGNTLLGAFTATPLPGPPAQVVIQAGDGQSVAHDAPVPIAPSVFVGDQYGNAVAGASVSFTVTAGGGSVTGSPATSGADGVATLGSWTLGSTVGTNTLRASVATASPAAFTATATPGAAVRLTLAAGDNQTAEANTRVPIRPAVRVTDAGGNAVAGIRVSFVPILGGNFVNPDTASSGADGVAAPSFWMLGTKTGPNTMQATAAGLTDTVVFHATATSGPVDADHSGIAAQPDKITTSTTSRIYVIARSAILNPVSGATVVFEATGSGNTIVQPSAPTDSAGYAEGQFSSTVLGQKIVSATINGIRITPTWTVTVQGGPPADLSMYAGNNQTAQVNTNVPIAPAVLIRDANGNAVPDAIAVFVITQGSGSIGGAIATTGQDGVAASTSLTLGTTAGTVIVRATVQGLADTVFFTATATAGPAATIVLQAGNNQSASAGTVVPIAPAVLVRDAFNNPVAGTSVQYDVTAGGGSINGTNPATTNQAGIAAIGGWVLGSTPGANTLTATAAALGTVTFSASGVAPVIAVTKSRVTVSPISIVASAGEITATVTVTARDTNNNPVVGVPVTLTASGTGNTITQPTTVTDANGVTTGAISSTVAQSKHVWATITGMLTFPGSVEVRGGPPVTMVAYAGDNQVASAGTQVPFAPQVLVRDQFGNGSHGTLVTWEVTSGGGSVGPNESPGVFPNGVATSGAWTLGTVAGPNTLRATIQGTPLEVTFQATGDPSFWTSHAAIPTRRFVLGAAAMNGLVYAVGGMDFDDMATVEAFDPATNTWSARAPLPSPRSELAVAVVNNVLYAIGGMHNRSVVGTVEAYDPVTDSWTPRAPMPTPRADFGVSVVNGIIYTIGGASATSRSVGTVEAYDPATDTWTTKAPMPTPRLLLGAAEAGGIIYAIGGSSDAAFWMATVEAYDPASDTWTPRAPLPTPRFGLGVAAIAGRVYALGGYTPLDNYANLTPILEAYDPATNRWTSKPEMLEGRVYMGTAVLQGLLYVVGGDGSNTNFVEAYHP
jgi:adhesin/invasin